MADVLPEGGHGLVAGLIGDLALVGPGRGGGGGESGPQGVTRELVGIEARSSGRLTTSATARCLIARFLSAPSPRGGAIDEVFFPLTWRSRQIGQPTDESGSVTHIPRESGM